MRYSALFFLAMIVSACAHIELPILSLNKTSKHSQFDKPDADLAYHARDYQLAAKLYLAAYRLNHKTSDLLAAAESYRLNSDITEAKQLYQQLLAKNENKIEATEGLSLCLMQEGRYEQAFDLLKDITSYDSTKWKTINALAVIMVLNNFYDKAVEYFTIALELSDYNYLVYNNLGLSQALHGDYMSAILNLNKAISLIEERNPNKARLELNLALAYGASNKLSQAETIAKKHLTGQQLYENMAFYANLAKNRTLADNYFKKALSGVEN